MFKPRKTIDLCREATAPGCVLQTLQNKFARVATIGTFNKECLPLTAFAEAAQLSPVVIIRHSGKCSSYNPGL